MSHAFTSKNLWQLFNSFPYNLPLFYEDCSLLDNEDLLARSLIKMADSGIFSKNGCTIGYEELFSRYNQIGADFGIMIDILREAKATKKSAQEAIKIYDRNKKGYRFKLVGVAQGSNLEEYLECYEKLSHDFEFVAIGGLLKKREKSARYVRVRDEKFLYEVLNSIKQEFKPQWLFVLGCYHPSRHKRFEEIGVWGSDYKGWIFNYQLKRQIVRDMSCGLSSLESRDGFDKILNNQKELIDKIESDLLIQERKWREAKNRSARIAIRDEVNQLKTKLEEANRNLLEKRELLASRNHMPPDYESKLMILKRLIEEKEQSLRFKQVRRYIENNVYGKLQ